MSMYKITVNGKSYDVNVEPLAGAAAVAAPQAAPVAAAPVAAPVPAPAPQAAPAPVAAPAAAAPAGSTEVTAPMPGKVLRVLAKVGDTVSANDNLLILEAMKMENEIQAPCDGKITGVNVRKGDSVETAALLCTIA